MVAAQSKTTLKLKRGTKKLHLRGLLKGKLAWEICMLMVFGVEQDLDAAMNWIRKVIDMGDEDVKFVLQNMINS